MFKEVEDARLLAVSLDNVQIVGKKIHANVPRFERNKRPVENRSRGFTRHAGSEHLIEQRGKYEVFHGK